MRKKRNTYRRACKLTLKFATQSKRNKINSLLEEYRRVVNFYIQYLWNTRGSLNKETLAILSSNKTRLSERYKSQALKQALEVVIGTKKSLKANRRYGKNIPIFNGSAILDAKFITIEEGNGSFDCIVRLSTLQPYKRITIPTKKTAVLNKWLSKPDATLIQGCALNENFITLFVEFPNEKYKQGKVLGLDQGLNKLISDSEGNHYGTDFKQIRDKIIRRKKGSKRRKQTYKERENFINKMLNKLPWDKLSTLVIEKLKDLKKGKKKNRSRAFRKAIAPWTYRQVISRIEHKCQENRVRLVKVDPQNTSRTCPLCKHVSKLNRKNEKFECVQCSFSEDADYVGALNIKERFLGSVESPRLIKKN